MSEFQLAIIRDSELKLGDRLKLMRKAARMNQTELARHLDCAQGTVSKIEAHALEPTVHQLIALRKVFGVSADSFLDGSIDYHSIAHRFGNRKFSLEKAA
jgi:transcriptional regulator with XRE-family HTH domain